MTTSNNHPSPTETTQQLETIRRVLEIRAAQPDISLAAAQRQAREDVAYSRGEVPKFTKDEIAAMSAAELREAIAKYGMDILADEPETAEERHERHRQGVLTNEEAADWQARIDRDFADKALRRVVALAREKQAADVRRSVEAGEDPAQARWRYSNLDQYLPPLAPGETQVDRQARVKDLEARDMKARTDFYKVGSDDDREDE